MDKLVKNQTNRVVMIRGTSGKTFYVGPKEVAKKIPELEIKGNTMFLKLIKRGIVKTVLEPNSSKSRKKKRPKTKIKSLKK